MKPIHVKPSTYIDSRKEINSQDPKFKIDDILKISKYKNIFAKGYVQNWSGEVFVIKKVENTVFWTYVISTWYLRGRVKVELDLSNYATKVF